MGTFASKAVTGLLLAWGHGDEAARDKLIALDAPLEELASFDPRQARIVELRLFGGLSIQEAAKVLGVSPATVKRDWSVAKAWLHRRLKTGN